MPARTFASIRFRASPESLAHSVGAIAGQRERLYSSGSTEGADDRVRLDVIASLLSHPRPVIAGEPDAVHQCGGRDDDNPSSHAPKFLQPTAKVGPVMDCPQGNRYVERLIRKGQGLGNRANNGCCSRGALTDHHHRGLNGDDGAVAGLI